MDNLNEVFASEDNTQLSDLVPEPQTRLRLPTATVRNESAKTALMGAPDSPTDTYQALLAEAETGDDTVASALNTKIAQDIQRDNERGMLSVLSDPKVDMETKLRAAKNIRNSQFANEPNVKLLSDSLAAPVKGESVDSEKARISTADLIRQIDESVQIKQGLINAHGASLDSLNAGTAIDATANLFFSFLNNLSVGKINKELQDKQGTGSLWNTVKGFLLPGTTVKDIREQLSLVPVQERQKFTQDLLDAVVGNSSTVPGNKGQFMQMVQVQKILGDSDYSATDEWMDNIFPLFDIFGIKTLVNSARRKKMLPVAVEAAKGSAPTPAKVSAKSASTVPAQKAPVTVNPENVVRAVPEKPAVAPKNIVDEIERIDLNATLRKEVPASPASIVSQANPEKAGAFHGIVLSAKDDVAAEALYGVPRMDAIASDILPQISTSSGTVTSKVQDIEKYLSREIDTLNDVMNSSGALQLTRAEKARAETHLMNDFSQAEGLTMNSAMSSFKNDGGRIRVAAVYGNSAGAFSDAKQAYNQAVDALKYQGIGAEDITILRKDGLDHTPVSLASVEGVPGNYLVKVESDYDITTDMIGKMDEFTVVKNWLDAIPQLVWERKGSATRWVFDPASVLDPSITGSAIEAVDKSSAFERTMLELAAGYTDKYNALSKADKGRVVSYIRQANTEGIALDKVDLLSRGFSEDMISAVTSWRKFWDAHYYLENLDIIRTLDMQGFGLLQNDKGLSLFTKKIPKNQNIARLYDPKTDSLVSPSKEEMDALYDQGGHYGKLKRPVEIDGVLVDHAMVYNDSSSYVRKLRSDDTALNYREGYYQIQYTATKFVDEIVKEGDRIVSRKAIAVAGDSKEAQTFADSMASNNPDKEYKVRGDDRAMNRGGDDWWDVNAASGRIAQRHRGKLLEGAQGINHLGDGGYMLDPVSSAVKAAKSISMRTMMRPVIEAHKARFMSKYAGIIPEDGRGGFRFPNSFAEIGAKGDNVSNKVRDARTEYEYIRFIENGYINSVDEGFKALMFTMAEATKKNTKTEKAFLAATEIRPSSVIKGSVFNAYLVGHPLRQAIIQSHQFMRSVSYNLPGWVDGGVSKYVTNYFSHLAGGPVAKGSDDFVNFINGSGILEAVDKHNLIRGTLLDAVGDARPLTRAANAVDSVLSVPRKYGFGLGEQGSMVIHGAAVYDKFLRDGKNLADKTVRAEAHSELRAITGDMNFAGDMPQNSTSLSAIFQFMQVPQKMLLQVSNRRLSVSTRLKLFAGDTLMWGSPTVLLASHLSNGDILPEDKEWRETLLLGAESMVLNSLLRWITEDKTTNVDFSSLSPSDTTGIRKMIMTMLSDGPLAAIAASPAGGLLGDTGRVQNALRAIARYAKGTSEYDSDPVTLLQTIKEVGKIFSGVNDATNAWQALEIKRSFDKIGRPLDNQVHVAEAAIMALGFKDASQRDMFVVLEQAKKDQKSYKDTVIRDYKLAMQYIVTKAGEGNTSPAVISSVTGFILNKYKDDPVAQEIMVKQMELDAQSPDNKVLSSLTSLAGIKTPSEMRDLIRISPIPDRQKQEWFELIINLEKLRNKKEE